jgi:hypothetical protein
MLSAPPAAPRLGDTWTGARLSRSPSSARGRWARYAFTVTDTAATVVKVAVTVARFIAEALTAAVLTRWRSAEAEAVAALPAPVPAGRGPPARCSATKDPCESANRNRIADH